MEIIKKAQVQEIIRRANQVVINPGLQRGGGVEKEASYPARFKFP